MPPKPAHTQAAPASSMGAKRPRPRIASEAIANGIETRGISDHGFIDSIYFRDPNGYVIELNEPLATAG